MYYKCNTCLSSDNSNCNECVAIEHVDNTKNLGIFIDKNCSWNKHIKLINRYMLPTVRNFDYLRNLCPVNVLTLIYFLSKANSNMVYHVGEVSISQASIH